MHIFANLIHITNAVCLSAAMARTHAQPYNITAQRFTHVACENINCCCVAVTNANILPNIKCTRHARLVRHGGLYSQRWARAPCYHKTRIYAPPRLDYTSIFIQPYYMPMCHPYIHTVEPANSIYIILFKNR